MKLDQVSNEHRLSFPRYLISGKLTFAYKFIVDGLWTCDGSLPMIEDKHGGVNNVYNVPSIKNSNGTAPTVHSLELAPHHSRRMHRGADHVRTPKTISSTARQYSMERRLPSPSVLHNRRLSHSATIK
jgi:hypothetical protein